MRRFCAGALISTAIVVGLYLIEAQRQRVRFGEEEQGSGRMTSFFRRRQKKTPEQSGLCSDDGRSGET